MPSTPLDDTITAIATPPGRSGIGIVRLSGPQALRIADGIFRPARNQRPSEQDSFTTRYGHVVADGEVVDAVLLTVMRGPRTYTTQDVVEINCHGGAMPLRRTLELVLRRGARLAGPGEFTRRAYCLGRLDLAQAEAVADLINAQTEAAQRAALRQLSGALSSRIRDFRDRLVELDSYVEAAIDFAEDDIDLLPRDELRARVNRLLEEVQALLASAGVGRAIREGLQVALAGRPNVGKSSLMNALLRADRVIVTPHPGTTRDVVEETINMQGLAVTLADTAGLREARDEIEQAGVERARTSIDQADLVLLVLDGAQPLQPEDRRLLAELSGPHTVVVLNKQDLGTTVEAADLPPNLPAVGVSALTGEGLDGLESAIVQQALGGVGVSGADVLVTNVRHQEALERTARALGRCAHSEAAGLTDEILAEDLRGAMDALGEITGDTSREDVIDRIFSSFCIGK